MWIITIRAPTSEPKKHQLHPGNNTIGRMAGNDIIILDPAASRYHAKLVCDEASDQVTLYDLDSTNGTFLNRKRLNAPVVMKAGDIIRIGQHIMELSFLGERTITQEVPPQSLPANTMRVEIEADTTLLGQIQQYLLKMPRERQSEVLDFINFLQQRIGQQDISKSQQKLDVQKSLEQLAALRAFYDISDPSAWQRQIRQDRLAPGDEA